MSKVLLIEIGQKSLYEDGTYKCDHWPPDHPYSEWKIEDGHWHFKHPGSYWCAVPPPNNYIKEINKAIQNRLNKLIEQDVLEVSDEG